MTRLKGGRRPSPLVNEEGGGGGDEADGGQAKAEDEVKRCGGVSRVTEQRTTAIWRKASPRS